MLLVAAALVLSVSAINAEPPVDSYLPPASTQRRPSAEYGPPGTSSQFQSTDFEEFSEPGFQANRESQPSFTQQNIDASRDQSDSFGRSTPQHQNAVNPSASQFTTPNLDYGPPEKLEPPSPQQSDTYQMNSEQSLLSNSNTPSTNYGAPQADIAGTRNQPPSYQNQERDGLAGTGPSSTYGAPKQNQYNTNSQSQNYQESQNKISSPGLTSYSQNNRNDRNPSQQHRGLNGSGAGMLSKKYGAPQQSQIGRNAQSQFNQQNESGAKKPSNSYASPQQNGNNRNTENSNYSQNKNSLARSNAHPTSNNALQFNQNNRNTQTQNNQQPRNGFTGANTPYSYNKPAQSSYPQGNSNQNSRTPADSYGAPDQTDRGRNNESPFDKHPSSIESASYNAPQQAQNSRNSFGGQQKSGLGREKAPSTSYGTPQQAQNSRNSLGQEQNSGSGSEKTPSTSYGTPQHKQNNINSETSTHSGGRNNPSKTYDLPYSNNRNEGFQQRENTGNNIQSVSNEQSNIGSFSTSYGAPQQNYQRPAPRGFQAQGSQSNTLRSSPEEFQAGSQSHGNVNGGASGGHPTKGSASTDSQPNHSGARTASNNSENPSTGYQYNQAGGSDAVLPLMGANTANQQFPPLQQNNHGIGSQSGRNNLQNNKKQNDDTNSYDSNQPSRGGYSPSKTRIAEPGKGDYNRPQAGGRTQSPSFNAESSTGYSGERGSFDSNFSNEDATSGSLTGEAGYPVGKTPNRQYQDETGYHY